MNLKRNESGATRPMTLAFVMAALQLCGFALLVAQELPAQSLEGEALPESHPPLIWWRCGL